MIRKSQLFPCKVAISLAIENQEEESICNPPTTFTGPRTMNRRGRMWAWGGEKNIWMRRRRRRRRRRGWWTIRGKEQLSGSKSKPGQKYFLQISFYFFASGLHFRLEDYPTSLRRKKGKEKMNYKRFISKTLWIVEDFSARTPILGEL